MKRLIIVALGLLAVIALVRVFPVLDWAVSVMRGLQAWGVGGAILNGLAFGLLTTIFVPGSVLTMLAGATWGLGGGVLIVTPGAALASTLSAALGRTLLRQTALEIAAKHPVLAALDQAIAEHPFRFVTLLRLSPVLPFALSNYGLGTTAAPLWSIGLGTLLGLIPITAVWAYLGTIAGEVVTSGALPQSNVRTVALLVGLAVTIGIVTWIGRRARQLLDAGKLPPTATPESP